MASTGERSSAMPWISSKIPYAIEQVNANAKGVSGEGSAREVNQRSKMSRGRVRRNAPIATSPMKSLSGGIPMYANERVMVRYPTTRNATILGQARIEILPRRDEVARVVAERRFAGLSAHGLPLVLGQLHQISNCREDPLHAAFHKESVPAVGEHLLDAIQRGNQQRQSGRGRLQRY